MICLFLVFSFSRIHKSILVNGYQKFVHSCLSSFLLIVSTFIMTEKSMTEKENKENRN